MTDETNELLVHRLRAIADFIEAHPDIPMYRVSANCYHASSVDMMFRGSDPTEERRNLTVFARAIGHIENRTHIGSAYLLKGKIGDIPVSMQVTREAVCRRVVTEETLPAEPEVTIPAKPARTVKIEKWECDNADGLDAKLASPQVQQGIERDIHKYDALDALDDAHAGEVLRAGGVGYEVPASIAASPDSILHSDPTPAP